jgi:hypothetical protein
MKKIILLFFAFVFTANAFAQKDSLIVLNKDVSINWTISRISTQQYSFDARFSFEFHNATFRGFYVGKRQVKANTRQSFDYPNDPEGITEYTLQSITSYQSTTKGSVNYPPILTLKYLKNKKIYSIDIPTNVLITTSSRPHGGNSIKKSSKSR